MRLKPLLIASGAVLTLALAPPAAAHRQWLLPSTTVLAAPGQYVTIDGAVSNDLFYADHQPLRTEQIKVWAADGTPAQIENAATGHYRSTFDVNIATPGTWKIGTEQSSVMGSFKVDGTEWRVGGRRGGPGGPGGPGMGAPGAGMAPRGPGGERGPGEQRGPGGPEGGPGGFTPRPSVATVADIPANATDVKLTEVSSRNFVFVTAGAPTKTVLATTGKGLELDPISHPDELVSNEAAQFRFLVDGKPAAGIKVAVVPGNKRFREAEDAQDLTTGADGIVHIKWPVAGVYWLSATLTDNHPSDPKASERRMAYTTTVEVPAP